MIRDYVVGTGQILSRSWQVLWFTVVLLGLSWLGIRTMIYCIPSPTVAVDLIELSLRVAHLAAEQWGDAMTGLAMILIGIVLAPPCLIPSLHGEGGYVSDIFESGDCD